jgi:protein TonB
VQPQHALETVLTPSPKLHGDRPQEGSPERRTATGSHLIAMTRDPALIHALQELAGGELTILLVEDLRRLADELVQHGTAVALLDAQSLGVPADAAVDAVKNQFPDVRLMVAGQATEQNLLATRISDQRVFRFVHKPASPQRLRLFLEAAASISPAARRADAAASAADPQLAAGSALPPRGGSSLLPIIAGAAAVLILAIGGWVLMSKKGEGEPAAAVSAGTTQSQISPQLQAVLARAQQAFSAGSLIAADGSSAAELYREALRLDPASTTAADGFERSIEDALTGAEQALLAGKLDQARITAELARLIVPDNSRLAFLYTQIERELARVNADATQRQALEARQSQIRSVVNAVEQRISRGALLEPATDSALSRFREAQAIGAGDPMVRGSRDALVGALLTAADKELEAGRVATARRMVEAAGSVNSSAPALDIMRRRIDEADSRQAAAESASTNASAGTPVTAPATVVVPAAPVSAENTPGPAVSSTSPAVTSAPPEAAPAPAGDNIVSALTLRAVRKAQADYPLPALDRMVSGWVDMEFTVAKDGTVQNVVVVESQPRRTFDSAAMTAMKRWRFAPVLRDGQPVEQRASMRMRFTATEDR